MAAPVERLILIGDKPRFLRVLVLFMVIQNSAIRNYCYGYNFIKQPFYHKASR
uniref:Uncharacterized protein n=1 Tax=Arundo donax TaxID=35708 RepID=A0A0A8Z6H0_ARUDO